MKLRLAEKGAYESGLGNWRALERRQAECIGGYWSMCARAGSLGKN